MEASSKMGTCVKVAAGELATFTYQVMTAPDFSSFFFFLIAAFDGNIEQRDQAACDRKSCPRIMHPCVPCPYDKNKCIYTAQACLSQWMNGMPFEGLRHVFVGLHGDEVDFILTQ